MQNSSPSSHPQAFAPASMISFGLHRMKRVTIVMLALLILCGTTHAQTQVKLTSGDVVAPGGLGQIGKSIAFDGNTVVVGSVDGGQTGSVYVYGHRAAVSSRSRSGLVRWGRLATLVAPSVSAGERFGFSVAVGGNSIVVGAPGSVYIFQRNEAVRAAAWSLVAQLTAPNSSTNDLFGFSVAISGSTLVIGAPGDSALGFGAGAAYVFEREESGDWAPTAGLVGSDAEAGSRFGYAVAIDGDNITVGAMGHNSAGLNSGGGCPIVRGK